MYGTNQFDGYPGAVPAMNSSPWQYPPPSQFQQNMMQGQNPPQQSQETLFDSLTRVTGMDVFYEQCKQHGVNPEDVINMLK